MIVTRFILGPVEANCYLCAGSDGHAVIIDPGDDPARLLDEIRKNGLTLDAILLTHGHFDHVGGAALLREFTGARVMITREDARCLTEPMAALAPVELCTPDRLLEDGNTITVGEMTFTCLLTPGHSPGSCVYLCEDRIFSGDTLFAGTCGRWDLPGGDFPVLLKSLRRIARLQGWWRVLPGHGEETDLETERQTNPMLDPSLQERWC